MWRDYWGFGPVKQRHGDELVCTWNLPDPTRIKLNFDGSKKAEVEFVIRNDTGQPLTVGGKLNGGYFFFFSFFLISVGKQ